MLACGLIALMITPALAADASRTLRALLICLTSVLAPIPFGQGVGNALDFKDWQLPLGRRFRCVGGGRGEGGASGMCEGGDWEPRTTAFRYVGRGGGMLLIGAPLSNAEEVQIPVMQVAAGVEWRR